MLSHTLLITGGNRGLGLEMVSQLLAHAQWRPRKLIATCRQPREAVALRRLAERHPDTLQILALEVTDYEGLPAFVERVQAAVGSLGLGCLVNNAGVSPGLTRLNTVQPQQMLDTFNVNTVAPLMISQALLPLLKASSGQNLDQCLTQPVIVNMSSILGSIQSNEGQGGGIYPYRASKTALNIVTRSLSKDLRSSQVQAIAIHPGWVQTDMGGPNAPIKAPESITGILGLLAGGISEAQNGNFYDYEGKPVPW